MAATSEWALFERPEGAGMSSGMRENALEWLEPKEKLLSREVANG